MKYDLHIHSGLSPCAHDEMSPNNILTMAKLNDIKLIAITDHNSFAQQRVMAELAIQHDIQLWFGAELTTKEEVHVLAYFPTLRHALNMQRAIMQVSSKMLNNADYFGHQWLYDANDGIIGEWPNALLASLDMTLEECVDTIHQHEGKAVLAHIYDKANGVIQQLGFIPNGLLVDGIELKTYDHIERFRIEYPHLMHLPVFINSDAHQLRDMVKTHYPLPTQAYWFNLRR